MTVDDAGAVADAVSVTVALHEGEQLAGLNALALTPVGRLVTMLKVTADGTPAVNVAVAVSTPPTPPEAIVNVDGVAARLKLNAAAVTASVKVAVLVAPPPTAWIVMTVDDEGAVADAVRVTVALQVGEQLAGVKALAVTAVGRAVVILNVTAVVVPAVRVAVAVSTAPAAPPVMDSVAGVAARLKLKPAAVTTSVNVAV
jgi:hypothetical protein